MLCAPQRLLCAPPYSPAPPAHPTRPTQSHPVPLRPQSSPLARSAGFDRRNGSAHLGPHAAPGTGPNRRLTAHGGSSTPLTIASPRCAPATLPVQTRRRASKRGYSAHASTSTRTPAPASYGDSGKTDLLPRARCPRRPAWASPPAGRAAAAPLAAVAAPPPSRPGPTAQPATTRTQSGWPRASRSPRLTSCRGRRLGPPPPPPRTAHSGTTGGASLPCAAAARAGQRRRGGQALLARRCGGRRPRQRCPPNHASLATHPRTHTWNRARSCAWSTTRRHPRCGERRRR